MALSHTLPSDKQRQIDAELTSGETLLWTGQPAPGRLARMGIVACLVGIPFTLFSIVWTSMAGGASLLLMGAAHHSPGGTGALFAPVALLPLFGLVFVFIGLGLLLSPLWLSLRARRTIYAVTNMRVLVIEKVWWGGTRVRSIGPTQLREAARTQQGDGSGDLLFPQAATLSYQPSTYSESGGMAQYSRGRYVVNSIGFYGIPDVKAVDDLIRRTFQSPDPGDFVR